MKTMKYTPDALHCTRAFRYSRRGRESCQLGDIVALHSASNHTVADSVVVIENISLPWTDTLVDAWKMERSFFELHTANPIPQDESSTWNAIFGTSQHQRTRSSDEPNPRQHGKSWHVDGIFRYGDSSVHCTARLTDPNFSPRLLEFSSKYGWQANTRISCYVNRSANFRTCSSTQSILLMMNPADAVEIDLVLVDAPMTWLPYGSVDRTPIAYLHLPLALNRGGLVLPPLFETGSMSLEGSLQQFLSHQWHLNVLFSTEMLSAEPLLHLLVASTWEQNLRFLDSTIKKIAFKDIRRPNSITNDRLHDLREKLISLRDSVLVARKWEPASVHSELALIASSIKSEEIAKTLYIGYPEHTLQDILDRAETLEAFLMDSFQLFMSSTSLMNAELSVEQAKRSQRLTQLASLYLPLSFVTGVFGMNIHEINDSRLPVWVPICTLAITAVCTVIIFFAATRWEVLLRRLQISDQAGARSSPHNRQGSLLPPARK